jgi:hypothetical protein
MSKQQNVKTTKCQNNKMSKQQNVKTTKCQNNKMSKQQNVHIIPDRPPQGLFKSPPHVLVIANYY